MKSKLIRIAVIVMAMLMLVSVVGCGTTTKGKDTVSIVFDNAAGDSQAQLEIQQKIKTMGENITVLTAGATDSLGCQVNEQRYAQLCGGKVTWVSSEGYSELQQKLASMHMSDEAPDIYPFSNQDYPSILYKGILAPLDDLIDLNNEVFAEDKIYIDGLRWDGQCYLLPNIGTSRDLFVNKQLLIDAGIPESEWPDAQYKAGTWTWDSMFDIVKRVSNPDEGIYGFGTSHNLLYAFACSAGVDFVKLTEDGLVDNTKSAEITRAMNMMKNVYANVNYSPALAGTGESGIELFKRGKLCLYYDMLEQTSNEILGEQLQNGDIFFAPFPRDPKVDKTYRMGDIAGVAIPAGSKHVNGAVAYLLAPYCSDYYDEQIKKINVQHRNWDDATIDYYYEDLMKREAILCFSLGIKEIQRMMWDATAVKNLAEKANWETIANELGPKIQQELDMLG